MSKTIGKFAAWFTLCGSLAFAGIASAEDRPADKILADIKAVEMPTRPTDLNNQASVQAYITAQRAALEKKAELIGELFKAYPENSELATLIPVRWQVLRMKSNTIPTIKAEADVIIAKSHDDKLVAEAYYNKAMAAIMTSTPDTKPEAILADIEEFAKKYPKDLRVPSLFLNASASIKDPVDQEKLFNRIETDYPNTTASKQVAGARKRAEGERKKYARVGKPFELEFTDAIKGTQVSMASLKGKVVVIDFWATWCGPCIAEIPNMKRIYAEYKDKGVEFIGVSLDQPKEKGGLDKLKDYVAKNGLEWPQYYQGNYWASEFSSSWGINSIPCVFLIDADGNLASIEARGQLEKMIPEYLEKAKAKKTASNP